MKSPGTSPPQGDKKIINSELWQACAGPLVNLPVTGTHVVYFPQGHSEQVAASMKKDVNGQIPNYPNLPSKLICLLHDITLHADPETDEVYAQMTLQPVPSFDQEALLRSEISMRANKPQTEFFCKTLTPSDTSTHGGFSVPRRAAEKILPPLDFSIQPPAQELVARDLHDNLWTFRHIYRGQPKRHLLTTGWSLFISGKKLFAGDSVLFIRDEKQHLLLGTRRANRQPANLSASVMSSDSMHIGILAAAAHAAANNSQFTVFYNPRTSPSEFVIPLAKYYKAVCGTQISHGMRFRMVFETEDAGTRRYMGTVTGLSDLDPLRWKNSQWRNLQVGWDESTAEEKRNRVSIWEIEPVIAPFFICPTPSFFRMKRSRQYGMPDDDPYDVDYLFKRTMPWPGDDFGIKNPSALPGLSLAQWMNMQQNPSFANSIQPNSVHSLPGSVIQNLTAPEVSRQLSVAAPQISQQNYLQFNSQSQTRQLDRPQKLSSEALDPLGAGLQPQEQLPDMTSQVQPQLSQGQHLSQSQDVVHQKQSLQSQHMHRNLPQNLPQQLPQQKQQILSQGQQQNVIQPQQPNNIRENIHMSDNQIQLQFLQKLHKEQQSVAAQQSTLQHPSQVPQLNHISENIHLTDNQIQLQFLQKLHKEQQSVAAQQSTLQHPSQVPQLNHISENIHLTDNQIQLQFLQKLHKEQQSVAAQQSTLQHPSQVPQLNHISENIHLTDNQIQLQFLQKLHKEQQSLAAQQSTLQQPSQVPKLQDQQKPMLDGTQDFSRSVSSSSMLGVPPTVSVSFPQSLITGTNGIQDFQFPQSHQQTKIQSHHLGMFQELHGHVPTSNQLSPNGSSLLTGVVGGGQSVVTDDIPSCSTSPSTNNCPSVPQPTMIGKSHCNVAGNKIPRPSATLISHRSLEVMPTDTNLGKNMQQKPDIRPSLNISKTQDQGYSAPRNYNNARARMDYVDSSSATSVCFDQSDEPLQPNANPMTFNSLSMLFSDMHGESQVDDRSNIPFGVNVDSQFVISDPSSGEGLVGSRKEFLNDLPSGGGMVSGYENAGEAQPELSSSMVSQSFGVTDMAFNSIDSSIKDSIFLNNAGWAPPPQLPRIRTYTKVYKRGAVGRSIDIARYSGYEELKQDLARRFGIEGQLEDRQRIGWKLVYVDHENDVLLVGDDPWEEFVNCVKCIKILSPQEVQQMSLDGDFGNCVLPDFGTDGVNL